MFSGFTVDIPNKQKTKTKTKKPHTNRQMFTNAAMVTRRCTSRSLISNFLIYLI